MGAKHTPEPWEAYYEPGGDVMRIQSAEGTAVVDIKVEVGSLSDEYRSNNLVVLLDVGNTDLSLLLAAPEMYAIVQGLLDVAKTSPDTELPAWIWEKAREIAAKVEGT